MVQISDVFVKCLKPRHFCVDFRHISCLKFNTQKRGFQASRFQASRFQASRFQTSRFQGGDSPTLLYYLSFRLAFQQWKTLLEEKTLILEIGESQPRCPDFRHCILISLGCCQRHCRLPFHLHGNCWRSFWFILYTRQHSGEFINSLSNLNYTANAN